MINLESKTRKGQYVITKWGSDWEVHSSGSSSLIMIVSILDESRFDKNITPHSARWINEKHDPDFRIT